MTEYTELEAMQYLQTMLSSTLDPTPQTAPTGVYVYPEDYEDSLTGLLPLPIVIISQKVALSNQWIKKAQGHTKHEWLIEVLVLLALGPLKYPNSASALAESMQTYWAKAMATSLFLDLDFGGRIGIVGLPRGQERMIFTYTIEHSQWNQQIYWGLVFNIPVFQFHTLVIGGI